MCLAVRNMQSYRDALQCRVGRWCRRWPNVHWDSGLGSVGHLPPAPPDGEVCWRWLCANDRRRSRHPQVHAALWPCRPHCPHGRGAVKGEIGVLDMSINLFSLKSEREEFLPGLTLPWTISIPSPSLAWLLTASSTPLVLLVLNSNDMAMSIPTL